ncbi:hypothetical protein [Microbacterium sp. VKM Ac-2923]|uniref:hypothetical protein n=1 Tax=Microbacterium sp. VKM Ac-2923 TaxID=2929476 RepID=UPI001FB44D53|nr:hypothetical protein [Microbacterium sp. VKM Ac-2923]MCJ1706408.1 hypothetical protein [Microbacterium sp. VKM Ac-2923]
MSRRRGTDSAPARLGRLRRVAGWVIPLASFVVILFVLRGAGVPLSVPGVIVVVVLLAVARMIVGRSRRGRRDRPTITPPDRSR